MNKITVTLRGAGASARMHIKDDQEQLNLL